MIFRLLLTLFFIILLVVLVKRLLKVLDGSHRQDRIEHFADTVTCHKCGVRLAEQDAIRKNGRYYCCEEHAGDT